MLADAGVIALWSAAYAVDEAKYGSSSPQSYDRGTNLLVASGVAVYFSGGPAIHWAHGHGRKGLGSLGLRVGLPLGGLIAGALLGTVACGSSDNEFVPCPAVIGALGFLGGAVAAPIVDAAVVAREPVTDPPVHSFKPPSSRQAAAERSCSRAGSDPAALLEAAGFKPCRATSN